MVLGGGRGLDVRGARYAARVIPDDLRPKHSQTLGGRKTG